MDLVDLVKNNIRNIKLAIIQINIHYSKATSKIGLNYNVSVFKY